MEFTDSGMIMTVFGAVAAIASFILTLQKVTRNAKQARMATEAMILQEAKEEDKIIRIELENKISALETKLQALEESVEKDFTHVRETFNGEIRNLGQKIEDLRADLRNQHGQLVSLLTKMIGPNE